MLNTARILLFELYECNTNTLFWQTLANDIVKNKTNLYLKMMYSLPYHGTLLKTMRPMVPKQNGIVTGHKQQGISFRTVESWSFFSITIGNCLYSPFCENTRYVQVIMCHKRTFRNPLLRIIVSLQTTKCISQRRYLLRPCSTGNSKTVNSLEGFSLNEETRIVGQRGTWNLV